MLVLHIITPRKDGCEVRVRENKDGTLRVTLVSSIDNISVVDSNDKLPKAELFDWINTREDW